METTSIFSLTFHKIRLRKHSDLLIDIVHWYHFSQMCNLPSKAEWSEHGHSHSYGALGRLIKRLDTNQHEFPRRISVISVRALPRTPGCSLKYRLLNQCSPLHFLASCPDLLSRKSANSLAKTESSQTFETPVGTHAAHARHFCTRFMPKLRLGCFVRIITSMQAWLWWVITGGSWRCLVNGKKTQCGHRLPKDRKNINCT